MRITVKLFAHLRNDRFKVKEMEFPEGTTVGDVMDELSISPKELDTGIIFINGKHSELYTVLNNGDTLSVFPPVAGG